jgi:hypothetical protein
MDGGDVYEPSLELEAEAHARVLGGTPTASISLDESREDRRQRMLAATLSRLHKEEEDLEHSCGTTGSSTTRTN